MKHILYRFATWSENFINETNVASYYNRFGHKGIFPSKQMPVINMGYWEDVNLHEPKAIDHATNAFFELVCNTAEISTADNLVLDVGCGYGTNAIYCAQHFQPQHIIGLNLSQVQIKVGQKLIAKASLNHKIKILKGNATYIPLPNASVDKILCIEAASHFRTRENFFYEAQRVLQPGGILVLADYVIPPSEKLKQKMLLHTLRYPLLLPKVNVYNRETYLKKLKAAGFDVVSATSIHHHVIPSIKQWVRSYASLSFPGYNLLATLGLTILYSYPMDYLCIKACKKGGCKTV